MNPFQNLYGSLPLLLLYIALIWSIAWKGIALWNSARESQRNWFIALLLLNTLGILDIVYLVFFKKGKKFWKRT